MKLLEVHFLPEWVAADRLAGSTCVVVDVLRATTTMIEALAAGAEAVVPCLTIEDARERAAEFPSDSAILGGERGGIPIASFDLGNSPAEYTAERVRGKTVVLTTTNGTKALLHCRAARRVLVGAMVNLSAVAQQIRAEGDEAAVHIVCAGTDGQVTREDVLFAGALVERTCDGDGQAADRGWRLNDEAQIALEAWRWLSQDPPTTGLELKLANAFRVSLGGQNLIAIGMEDDLRRSALVDRHAIVPAFDVRSGLIVPAGG